MSKRIFKNFMLVTVMTVLCFAVAMTASAATEYEDGYYTYTVSNNVATITDVDSSIKGDITIPSTLDGYPVVTIGHQAFRSCSKITSITIPDSVSYIEGYAFDSCGELESVTISDSVTRIDSRAFGACNSLTSVTIPASVTLLSSDSFISCKSLTKITVDENNTQYSNDSNGVLFNKNKNILVQYPSGNSATSYVIPDSVSYIESYAFSDCDSLESVTFSDEVYSIFNKAFYDCDSLKSITIPESVGNISDEVFACCDSLANITVDENNKNYTTDSRGVLFDKNKVLLIQYPIGNTATSYTIPDSVTKIDTKAFYGCSNLESIIIPDSVTTIGSYAFYDCSSLKAVTIPDSVTTIGSYAFYDCSSLKAVTIPDGVTSIAGYTFYNCTNLESVTIPDSVTSIGGGAFNGCSSLESVTIPNGVTTIDHAAFSHCNSLVDVTIPDSVTTIGSYAFSDCTNVKSMTIPDNVTTIGNSAFNNCISLESVNIPNSVTTISAQAFSNCSSLTNIIIPKSVTEAETNIFSGCSSINHVGYEGSESEWNNTFVSNNLIGLRGKEVHFNFNSETDITERIAASTCLINGIKATVCSCGYTYNLEELPLAECSFTVYEPDNNATCTVDGTKTAYCDYGCGKTDTVTDKGSALGHDMGDFVTTKEPTCTVKGEARANCLRCDYFEIKKLAVIGHKDENFDGYCEYCKEYIADENCICICHAKTIGAFVYRLFKIVDLVFKTDLVKKVFGISGICACGIAHY